MNVRIRFSKYSVVKFIGHLDVMRYFQKAIRRAQINVAYSAGFNPHQIMSFAAPLGVGLTSDGEYLDIEINAMSTKEEMIAQLNQQMNEGFLVTGFEVLKDPEPNKKKETAMALVAAADYLVSLKDGYEFMGKDEFKDAFLRFYQQESIVIRKKTKKSEKDMDIKPFIYDVWFEEREKDQSGLVHADRYENGVCVSMQLATGSVINVKPDLVMEAFCAYIGKEFNPYAFQLHRMETYGNIADTGMSMEEMIEAVALGKEIKRELKPLLQIGIYE